MGTTFCRGAVAFVRSSCVAGSPMRRAICILSIVCLAAVPSAAYAQGNFKAVADELARSAGTKAGLCVHLGCRDGALTAGLAERGDFLVHGLDHDAAMVEKARRGLQAQGLNGRVSIEETSWQQPLPYPDNTVNLLVADDLPGLLADGLSVREIVRVLTPNGVACIGKRAAAAAPALALEELKVLFAKAGLKDLEIVRLMGTWAKIKKPLNPKTDEWNHFQHDPGRNPVSNDSVVGPATQLRWLNGPCYFNSYPGLIVARGLVLFGQQEWMPEGKRVQWVLVARDAYNGCLAWRRPIDYYSPVNMAADAGRLYLPLGASLGALDLRTGETLFTLPEDVVPAEREKAAGLGTLAVIDGTIIVRDKHRPVGNIYVVDAATQKLLWKQKGIRAVAGEGLVFVSSAETLSAFDLQTGQEKWKLLLGDLPNLAANTAQPDGGKLHLAHYAYGRLVLLNALKNTQVYAVSARDGKYLWDYTYPAPYRLVTLSYPEEIWLVTNGGGRGDGLQVALDPATGKEKRRFPKLIPNSCATLRGAKNYILGSPKGSSYYLDLRTLELVGNRGFRSQCAGEGGNQVPANGLQYYIPCWCQCGSVVRGLFALGADEAPPAISQDQPHPLVKGTAAVPTAVAASEADWPCCRKDVRRSNATTAAGPSELFKLWESKVGQGRVSPLTVAGGLAYAADVDGLQVCAFDSATGKERWRYPTGCRVDVPPTIEKGLCLFGGKDGWVYCLDARTGQLAWRYRAAPADRRIVVSGRLESSWPIVGGVLVQNDVAYVESAGQAIDCKVKAAKRGPAGARVSWVPG